MSKVLTTVLVLFGFTIVFSLPAKRSPFSMRYNDLEQTRRLPRRLREFDRNNDGALNRKELADYFKATFDDLDHLSQNVEEVFYVLDNNDDGEINVEEAEPLQNL